MKNLGYLMLAPFISLVYILFLPFIGIVFTLYALLKLLYTKAVKLKIPYYKYMVFNWEPNRSYFTGCRPPHRNNQKKDGLDQKDKPRTDV